MERKKHILSDAWENFDQHLSASNEIMNHPDLTMFLSEILSIGPYYYYTFDVLSVELKQVHPNVLRIHGFKKIPTSLTQIIELIHPDDIEFVILAEKLILNKLLTINNGDFLHNKMSYSFRMRVADGSYHLFLHQAVHLVLDEEQKIKIALNIHTDIEHITQLNSGLVHIQSNNKINKHLQFDPYEEEAQVPKPKLSRREMQILPLIAKGSSSKQIAAQLFISEDTVRVHRKNILKKTNTNSSHLLIKKCLEWGIL
ncbi:LuxR C-terminal-related transcriptional regulator [Sphingobacterium sp. 1.A.4]|uniref:LuxR C-terminal-related transcriptional regulator n=1 Tax=Sphingobacterium sp. 1.A.4 TaxID=2044603 RepID=UPI000C0C04AA|nr:LuxR C-terminal-related transcriptional regulator [Sphingobacterium sp. 1.A.4]